MTAGVHRTALVSAGSTLHPSASIGAFTCIGEDGEAPVVVAADVLIGAHATVLPGVRIGRGARVIANSVVFDDVPPHAIVAGGPAVIVGYQNPLGNLTQPGVRASELDPDDPKAIDPASMVRLQSAADMRGSLVVGEFSALPFVPKRFFCVYGVQSGKVRGEHAHHRCEQLLVALHGSVRCIVDDGRVRREVVLDTPTVGLHLPALVWGTQFGHSEDAVLLVLASEAYDHADYIRDYEEYLALVGKVDTAE